MIRIVAGAGFAALLVCAAAGGRAAAEKGWSEKIAVAPPVEKTIARWPERAKAMARVTMAKYGKPDEVGEDALVWHSNGPWKKTIVHRRAWPHYTLHVDKDYLENTIGYRVPVDKLDELTRFDKKLDVDPLFGELSSRSESESMNFLSLNVADEIVSGRRTAATARDFLAKVVRYSASGKSSPYMKGLLFETKEASND